MVMKTKNISSKIAIILICLIGLWLVFKFFSNQNKDTLLKNSKTDYALIKKIYHGGVKNPRNADFEYSVNGKQYEFNQPGDYDAFKLGDTILIEYAVADHSVARVVDKYYMQKYKHLKKKEN